MYRHLSQTRGLDTGLSAGRVRRTAHTRPGRQRPLSRCGLDDTGTGPSNTESGRVIRFDSCPLYCAYDLPKHRMQFSRERSASLWRRMSLAPLRRCAAASGTNRSLKWRSLGESNPCPRRERAVSWTARRRELERRTGHFGLRGAVLYAAPLPAQPWHKNVVNRKVKPSLSPPSFLVPSTQFLGRILAKRR